MLQAPERHQSGREPGSRTGPGRNRDAWDVSAAEELVGSMSVLVVVAAVSWDPEPDELAEPDPGSAPG